MLHQTWSTTNYYERKIKYDWPYVQLTKADLHMSHLIESQIDVLIMVCWLLDTYIKNWKFWGCWKLRQTSSQGGSQKLLQGLMSHKLTTYLSIFNLFKLNELWSYYQKHVNQIILNHTTLWSLALRIFKAFFRILLIGNLSLNQTLLTFLLCVRQTWMTQLILAISLWGVIFL